MKETFNDVEEYGLLGKAFGYPAGAGIFISFWLLLSGALLLILEIIGLDANFSWRSWRELWSAPVACFKVALPALALIVLIEVMKFLWEERREIAKLVAMFAVFLVAGCIGAWLGQVYFSMPY